MAKIKFIVTRSKGVLSNALSIAAKGEHPKEFTRKDQAELDLKAGDHVVYWSTLGEPSEWISLVVKNGETVLAEVKKSRIPANDTSGWGRRPFTV